MGGRDSFARVQILTGVHRCSTALISRPLGAGSVQQMHPKMVVHRPKDASIYGMKDASMYGMIYTVLFSEVD